MIETRYLTKRFGTLTALDDLTLSIGPGEIFGFIGPNGAGKSTTMKILACLMRSDAGSASVCGFDVATDGDDIRRCIGYMPDFLGVYDDLTVDEYLQFFAAAFKIPAKTRRATIDSVLELTDLTEKKTALVDSLSRGMQQRLGVARVLVHDPKVLLLDEPASGLDPRARIEMRSLLLELKSMGKCLMVSSHILSELAEMCTSIGIIERGKLLYAGSISEAYAKARASSKSGTERIRLTLAQSSPIPSQLAAAIQQHGSDPRIINITHNDALRELHLHLDTTQGDDHHFVIELALRHGARIAAMMPDEDNLEDAFLKLTKGSVQ